MSPQTPHIPRDQSRVPDMQLVIASRHDQIEEAEKFSEQIADRYEVPEDDRDNLAIAITELVNNAIFHGNKLDPNKSVIVSVYHDRSTLSIYIKDHGHGFDPKKVENPLEPENLLKENGRGIHILQAIMDSVTFDVSNNGTEVKIQKTF